MIGFGSKQDNSSVDDIEQSAPAPTPQGGGRNTYKFMTNLFRETKDRTRYIKLLEKITPNPYVTFYRLVFAMAALATILIVTVYLLVQPSTKLFYTGIWVVLAALASVALVAMFALPHRESSLIIAVINYAMFKLSSNRPSSKAALRTIGIAKLRTDNDGYAVIKFTNGDVGRVFNVSGSLGLSTLPAIADSIAAAKHSYLIARADTTDETLITRVTRAQFNEQLLYMRKQLKAIADNKYGDSMDLNNQWRSYMLEFMYRHVYDNMRGSDTVLQQFLVLRETDMKHLFKAEQLLLNSASDGLYASVVCLKLDDLRELLASLTLSTYKNSASAELARSIAATAKTD